MPPSVTVELVPKCWQDPQISTDQAEFYDSECPSMSSIIWETCIGHSDGNPWWFSLYRRTQGCNLLLSLKLSLYILTLTLKMLCEPSQPEKTLFYTSVISQFELVWNGDKRWFSYWSSINDINTQEFSLKNRFILTPMITHFLLETLSSVYVGLSVSLYTKFTFLHLQLNTD